MAENEKGEKPEERELAQSPADADPEDQAPADDRGGKQGAGGGPEKSETITREWHERRLRKVGQKREAAEARARRAEDQLKLYQQQAAKTSAADLLKDLGLPPEQAVVVGAMGKLGERLLEKMETRLSEHAESIGSLKKELLSDRRHSMLRNLDDDQRELVQAIAEETGIEKPHELLTLARMRDPELFMGYEPENGSREPGPARGSPTRGKTEPKIEKDIRDLEAQVNDPKNRHRQQELGPKLMALKRQRDSGFTGQ